MLDVQHRAQQLIFAWNIKSVMPCLRLCLWNYDTAMIEDSEESGFWFSYTGRQNEINLGTQLHDPLPRCCRLSTQAIWLGCQLDFPREGTNPTKKLNGMQRSGDETREGCGGGTSEDGYGDDGAQEGWRARGGFGEAQGLLAWTVWVSGRAGE
ncbi:hypothetical protein ARMGADRAFT_1111809 [Armillaria gallica]|nr:hypothetical protein ARMGADRAFT_1111809 [Armillaria gallica]